MTQKLINDIRYFDMKCVVNFRPIFPYNKIKQQLLRLGRDLLLSSENNDRVQSVEFAYFCSLKSIYGGQTKHGKYT